MKAAAPTRRSQSREALARIAANFRALSETTRLAHRGIGQADDHDGLLLAAIHAHLDIKVERLDPEYSGGENFRERRCGRWQSVHRTGSVKAKRAAKAGVLPG